MFSETQLSFWPRSPSFSAHLVPTGTVWNFHKVGDYQPMSWGQESKMCFSGQRSSHLQTWGLWRLQRRMMFLPFLASRLCPLPGFGYFYHCDKASIVASSFSSSATFVLCSQALLCFVLMKTPCLHLGPGWLVQPILPTLITLINHIYKVLSPCSQHLQIVASRTLTALEAVSQPVTQ